MENINFVIGKNPTIQFPTDTPYTEILITEGSASHVFSTGVPLERFGKGELTEEDIENIGKITSMVVKQQLKRRIKKK